MTGKVMVMFVGLVIVIGSFVASRSASALATPTGHEHLVGNSIENHNSGINSQLSNEIPTIPIANSASLGKPVANSKVSHTHRSRKHKGSKNPMGTALINAMVNSILDHKEVIITNVIRGLDTLLSGLLREIRNLLHKFFPTVITATKKGTETGNKAEKVTLTQERDPLSGVSQRRSDNVQHHHNLDFSSATTEKEEVVDDDARDEDKPLFVMPLLEKPISYNDLLLAQRLMYDSIDAYNAWQETLDEHQMEPEIGEEK